MRDYLIDPKICGIKFCENKSVALGLCANHWRRNRKFGSPLARKSHSGLFKGCTASERFELQVIRKDGCWGWRGGLDQDGYPAFKGEFDGVPYTRGHRYSYAAHTGEHPGRRHVCHTCDNPTCTNQKHLFLGTHAANMADKIAKGRHRGPQGEESGHARITEKQAKAILLDPRPYAEIAAEFGVAASTIGSIKNGASWGHLDTEAVKGGFRGIGRRGKSDRLTEQNIREIRASSSSGRELAEQYQISQQSICDIRKRRSWKHVE